MHDQEKSDSAIVAVKPPNKAGMPVTEAVEPRAETKGTADQQSTLRTQSRDRVNQADRKPSRSWASPTSAVDPAGDTSSFKGRPGATVSGRSYGKSRRSYGGECTSQSLFRDPG